MPKFVLRYVRVSVSIRNLPSPNLVSQIKRLIVDEELNNFFWWQRSSDLRLILLEKLLTLIHKWVFKQVFTYKHIIPITANFYLQWNIKAKKCKKLAKQRKAYLDRYKDMAIDICRKCFYLTEGEKKKILS